MILTELQRKHFHSKSSQFCAAAQKILSLRPTLPFFQEKLFSCSTSSVSKLHPRHVAWHEVERDEKAVQMEDISVQMLLETPHKTNYAQRE